ncbi:hypothetical protein IPN35_01010 [Candidatus Peregrinibacteria bacterium]|nr:MAG: hypothetical protein IPN35_01010 [Candidatus Peregrinibacteria bacterium]
MAFQGLLTQTATIKECTESNVGGVVKKVWTDKYSNLLARLSANRGTVKVGTENIEKYVRGEFTLYLEQGSEITEKMRAVIDGKEYEIAFVAEVNGKDSVHHLELQLNHTE